MLWDDQSDDAYLTWTQNRVTCLLEDHNLGLGLDDLLRIAASMEAPWRTDLWLQFNIQPGLFGLDADLF